MKIDSLIDRSHRFRFRKEEKRRKIQENRRLRQIQDNQQKRPSIVSKQDVSCE